MRFKQIVFLHLIGILVCIIFISFCLYESYRINKVYEETIEEIFDDLEKDIRSLTKGTYLSDKKPGRWYKLELSQPAHCDDFPSWFTSAVSRVCYDRDTCMKLWIRGSHYIHGIRILPKERNLPCHIAMWNNVNYNKEFCDFKAEDEIWFWREE